MGPRDLRRAVQDDIPRATSNACPLPASVANAKTMLVWRSGHRSAPLDALRQELR